MKTIVFFTLSFLFLSVSPVRATGVTEDAQMFFKAKLDAVVRVLQEDGVDDQVKKEKIMAIIIPVFDLKLMAKLSVGRNYWSRFSDIQKQRFAEVFRNRVQKSYMNTIMKFTNQAIVYQTPFIKKKKIHIPIVLISNNNRYEMVYKLYGLHNAWNVYDVEIQGVSILKSYRAQINEIMSNASFEELIQQFGQASP